MWTCCSAASWGHSISFADLPNKDFSSTANCFQISLRQSAPPLPYRRFKLPPATFNLMAVHEMPHFATNSGHSHHAGIGTYCLPRTATQSPAIGSSHARHKPMASLWPQCVTQGVQIEPTRNGSASRAARLFARNQRAKRVHDAKRLKSQAGIRIRLRSGIGARGRIFTMVARRAAVHGRFGAGSATNTLRWPNRLSQWPPLARNLHVGCWNAEYLHSGAGARF